MSHRETGGTGGLRGLRRVSYHEALGTLPLHPPTPAWSKGLASVTCDKRWSMNIRKLVTGDRECFLKEELGSS